MTRGQRVSHFLIDVFRWTGIRDRLRCPECGAVGTYKPHGGLLDREDVRKVRRWLCKWCGYYVGPEGVRWAVVDTQQRSWTLLDDLTSGELGLTPADAMKASPIPNTWPWRG